MTEPLDHSLRPAEPQDADFLAWAILTAARSHLNRGWFDIVLNRPEDACLDYLRLLTLTQARSWWHSSRFLVAEVDGRAVAGLSAFRAGDAYPLSQAAMTEAAASLGWHQAEQAAMWQRGAYIFTCTMGGSDDLWAIENIATPPEYRGHGLAGALIGRALEMGRERGCGQAQITSFIGNDAAERAYLKAGFRFAEEKRHADFEAAAGVPGLHRFVRDL